MVRKALGTIQWKNGAWWARVTMLDKSRPWIEIAGVPHADEKRARHMARILSERARTRGVVPEVREETVNEYLARWVAWRTGRGMTSAVKDNAVISKHFAKRHGHLPIAIITKAMLEDFVTELDEKVSRGELSWKSASNTWGSVSSLFRDAASAKDRTYRALDANAALGVARPDKGARRAKTYLYPNEFLQLVTCTKVPLVRRRLYAATTYLKLRSGEIEALEWSDVDLEHATVLVHLSIDRTEDNGTKTKATKSEKARRVRIEEELLPMLRVMKSEATEPRMFPVMPTRSGNSGYAQVLRSDLRRAKCARAELFETSDTRRSMTFHDLRATGLTWMAVRGDDALKIQATAGHSTFSTTQIYIREAEIHRAGFGAVFPGLSALFSIVPGSSLASSGPHGEAQNKALQAPPVGIGTTGKQSENTAYVSERTDREETKRPVAGDLPPSGGSWSDLPAFAGETGDDPAVSS